MKVATLCYLRSKNQTLLIHRNKREGDLFKDYWNGLGGKVEQNESPEECVIREMEEESGLKVQEPKLKGILTFPNNRDSGETWYVFLYIAEKFSGKLIENDEGELTWVENEEISKLNIQGADKFFIEWLDKPGVFSAKFYYKGEELIDHQVYFY